MNNEQYNQIIDEAYENYVNKLAKTSFLSLKERLEKEEFISVIKQSKEFSEKWGLKIEEIELSLEERKELAKGKVVPLLGNKEDSYNEAGIPTKRINVTYRPKCKLEYLDLKITILPSGKTFEDYE